MSVVFFCVGAAKAGTSWLHKQLSQHPECHFRAIKELHYFNALEQGALKRELDKHRGWQESLLANLAQSGNAPNDDQARRLADRGAWLDVLELGAEDEAAYLAYLQGGAEGARVVGDMTPAYALLPVERLQRMAAIAPDVRFLYLMRDPLDRLWSHVRMMAGRRDPAGEVTPEGCQKILNRTLDGSETEIVKRSDYATALQKLGAAINPKRVLIEVFEEVVAGDGLKRICDFLGIARVAPELAAVHEGQALAMAPAQQRLAMNWLAPQYAAAEAALGRRPDAWGQGGLA